MASTQNIKALPNPEGKSEGLAKKRKVLTAEYKIRILKEADALKGQPGAIGALLRREGLYSSSLSQWRKERDSGALSALSAKRGRKSKFTPQQLIVEKQAREIERLQEKLRQANLIIEAQKKISEIMQSMTPQDDNEKTR